MALDAGAVMHALVETLRNDGFNGRHVDVSPQADDEWARNFASVELHVEEPDGDDRRYFDYHLYCRDLCERVEAEFKKHGRFRVVWRDRSLVVAGDLSSDAKPGDRLLCFEVTPHWCVRVEFYVKPAITTRSRAQARA